MADILHRVGIDAAPEAVFDALTTIDGLRNWWTADTSGVATQGGVIDFAFCKMHVVEYRPDEFLKWECVDGPSDWVGTEITFRLVWKDNQTFVLFSHANWREPTENMHHCSTKWAMFLMSLKELLERSEGHPAPHDIPILVGD